MENKKKFYIVVRGIKTTGIGAILNNAMIHSMYAVDNGMIPVVDMKHYNNQYFKDGRTFKDNAWEYFFEQPAGYKLEDIDNDSEVTISDRDIPYKSDKLYRICNFDISNNAMSDPHISGLKTKYRKLFKFNKDMESYVNDIYKNVIGDNENVLGVLCRGTDYATRQTKNEAIQPSYKQVVKKVREYLKKYPEIQKIYLATEDDIIYNKFKKEFGDLLIDNGQYRYNYTEKDCDKVLSQIDVNRPNHNYQLAKEYLSSLYILSKCKYFVGGRCGGTYVAWSMENNWEDIYVWDLGKYGKINNWRDFLFSVCMDYSGRYKKKIIRILGIKIAITVH